MSSQLFQRFIQLSSNKNRQNLVRLFIRQQSTGQSTKKANNKKIFAVFVPLSAVGGFLAHQLFNKNKERTVCQSNVGAPDPVISADSRTDIGDKRTLTNTFHGAIIESRDLVQRIKDEVGSPGIVIAVSVDGKLVWAEGLGYADVENRVACHADSVMRIASISKPITMAVVARLWEAGKLDLDKPIQHYVPDWPQKTVNGEQVAPTLRQLASHTGGVRHYDKTCQKHRKRLAAHKAAAKVKKEEAKKTGEEKETKKESEDKKTKDSDHDEFFMKKTFSTVSAAIDIFKNDALCSKPGTEYLYTTHGFTLLSAAVEGASGKTFSTLLRTMFKDLDMTSSYLDENDPIIYNRAKFYVKNKTGRLVNAPFVNCSYKWAGGGMLSTVKDLDKFGNAMLYSYQNKEDAENKQNKPLPGYLKPGTVKALWTPVDYTVCDWDTYGFYGLGWGVVPEKKVSGHCLEQRFYASHTGGAVGASSALVVMPRKDSDICACKGAPQGVVVSVIANMQSVGLNKTALQIAKKFDAVKNRK